MRQNDTLTLEENTQTLLDFIKDHISQKQVEDFLMCDKTEVEQTGEERHRAAWWWQHQAFL